MRGDVKGLREEREQEQDGDELRSSEALPPHQAKTGLAGGPGLAAEGIAHRVCSTTRARAGCPRYSRRDAGATRKNRPRLVRPGPVGGRACAVNVNRVCLPLAPLPSTDRRPLSSPRAVADSRAAPCPPALLEWKRTAGRSRVP